MNKPPSRRELSHNRIVEAAARALRRGGYAGAGLVEIMSEAGLTHGGFYAHFASRDALLAEAVTRAGRDDAAALARGVSGRRKGVSPLRALVEGYLSEAHAAAETGCVVSALSSEMRRQAAPVREASAACARALVQRVQRALPDGARPAQAQVIASTMVGALQLARALGDADARQARALLTAARAALLAQHDTPQKGRRKGTS